MQVLAQFESKFKVNVRRLDKSDLPTKITETLYNLVGRTFNTIEDIHYSFDEDLNLTQKDKILKILDKFPTYDTIKINTGHVDRHKFIKLVGKDLLLDITVFKRMRSLRQNAYLHGGIIPAILEFEADIGSDWVQGKTDKELIALCKASIYQNVLGYTLKVDNVNGIDVYRIEGKHFSEMTTEEFNLAVDKVKEHYNPRMQELYGAKAGIPDPTGNNLHSDFKRQRLRNRTKI